MSKKNNLAKRRKQHEFDLQREKGGHGEAGQEAASQQIQDEDGGDNRKGGKFNVGKKKVKTKLSALAKAEVAQAIEVDK